MLNNGAGQGLLAEDWDVALAAPPRPAAAPIAAELPPAPDAAGDLLARTGHGLVLPDDVALVLDTALHGDRAPSGTPRLDGRPRSKNLTVLVGTVRVVTIGRSEKWRIFTELGAVEYRYELSIYELSINEVVSDEQSAARTLPPTDHDERRGARPRRAPPRGRPAHRAARPAGHGGVLRPQLPVRFPRTRLVRRTPPVPPACLFITHKCFVNLCSTYTVTTGEPKPQPLYRGGDDDIMGCDRTSIGHTTGCTLAQPTVSYG